MVGQPFDLLGQAVSIESLNGLDDAGVECPPPVTEEALIRHLAGEGVLEGISARREVMRLVEELGGLEMGETSPE
jgi:hypothetical protein